MNTCQLLAQHLRECHFGGNWSDSNLSDLLSQIDLKLATTRCESLHTIAELAFHMNYYVAAVLRVLRGSGLDAKDALSFELPSLKSEEAWQQLIRKSLAEAEALAQAIESLDAPILKEHFIAPEYGSYQRNLQGLIEHCHYHLGQIAMLRRLAQSPNSPREH